MISTTVVEAAKLRGVYVRAKRQEGMRSKRMWVEGKWDASCPRSDGGSTEANWHRRARFLRSSEPGKNKVRDKHFT